MTSVLILPHLVTSEIRVVSILTPNTLYSERRAANSDSLSRWVTVYSGVQCKLMTSPLQSAFNLDLSDIHAEFFGALMKRHNAEESLFVQGAVGITARI